EALRPSRHVQSRWEARKTFLLKSAMEILDEVRHSEFAGMLFDSDFPSGGGGYKDRPLPICDSQAGRGRQLGSPFEPPNQSVRVQENPGHSMPHSTSSSLVRGSNASFAYQIFP